MQPAELHTAVERAFNVGDVDALMDLYELDAQMVHEDGSVVTGVDAIRELWASLVSMGGQLTMTTRYAVESGDLALLSNDWTFTLGGSTIASAITAELARRQPDGSWRYLIDNPYGAPATRHQS